MMINAMKYAIANDKPAPKIPNIGMRYKHPIILTTVEVDKMMADMCGFPIPIKTEESIVYIDEKAMPIDTMKSALDAPKYSAPNIVSINQPPRT